MALFVKIRTGGVGWADDFHFLSLPTQCTVFAESIFALSASKPRAVASGILTAMYAARRTRKTIDTFYPTQLPSHCGPAKVAGSLIAVLFAE